MTNAKFSKSYHDCLQGALQSPIPPQIFDWALIIGAIAWLQVASRQLDEAVTDDEEGSRSVGLISQRMGRSSHSGQH